MNNERKIHMSINASAIDFGTSYYFNETESVPTESLGQLYQEAVKENLITKAWYAFRGAVLSVTRKILEARIDKLEKRYNKLKEDSLSGKVVIKGKSFAMEGEQLDDGSTFITIHQIELQLNHIVVEMFKLLHLVMNEQCTDISKYEEFITTFDNPKYKKHIKGQVKRVNSDNDTEMSIDEAIKNINILKRTYNVSIRGLQNICKLLQNKDWTLAKEDRIVGNRTEDAKVSFNDIMGWIDDPKLMKTIKKAMDVGLRMYMLAVTSWIKYFNAFKDADLVRK